MKTTKIAFRYYTINDVDAEEHWLRNMAKQGWMLDHVYFPGFYHFYAIEPTDIIYRLDYHPLSTKQKNAYIQMYADYGWTMITSLFGYHYFQKPAALCHGEETLFSDTLSKIDMVNRLIQGRLVPLCGVIIIILVFIWSSTLFHGLTIEEALGLTIFVLVGLFLTALLFFMQYRQIDRLH